MASSQPFLAKGTVSDLRIRSAELRDALAVARLLDALGYPCAPAEAEQRILRIKTMARQSLAVAELDENVVGMISLDFMFYLPLGQETCRITSLVVDPHFRNRKIGRTLLRFAESTARQEQALRIELTTAAQRTEAHKFYAAAGYAQSSLRFVKNLCSS